MKTLIIIANPKKESFSHAMAHAYQSTHPNATILDLYEESDSYFAFEETDGLTHQQQLIQEHDELVFFFPVWRGNMPAILKNFFDKQLAAGFAFKYVKGKALPNKLLKGKSAKIFCTCDGPSIIYRLPLLGIDIGRYIRYAILWFCGISTKKYKLFGSLRKRSKTDRKKILATVAAS